MEEIHQQRRDHQLRSFDARRVVHDRVLVILRRFFACAEDQSHVLQKGCCARRSSVVEQVLVGRASSSRQDLSG